MTEVTAPEKESEVEAFLQWGRLLIVGSPRWQVEPREIRAELPVRNAGGHPVRMYFRIPRPLPWQYHLVLVVGRMCIRRLDVRGSHTNPDPEREEWRLQTHKHRFTDRWGDRWAYTPDDLPPTPDDIEVTPTEYRQVFEAYCHECNINTSAARMGGPAYRSEERPVTALNCGQISEALAGASEVYCRPLEDSLLVVSPLMLGDGDHVQVLVRQLPNGRLQIDDFGSVTGRLRDRGLEPDDGTLRDQISEVAKTHGAEVTEDALTVEVEGFDELLDGYLRTTAAVLQADVLHVAARDAATAFSRRVVNWLEMSTDGPIVMRTKPESTDLIC